MNELLATLHHIDGTAIEQLAHFSREHLKHINANANISKLILREMLDGDSSRGRDLAEQVFSEYFSRLKLLLSKGQQRGEIRSDIDPDHMAAALAGINAFLFQSWSALQHFPGNAFTNQQESGAIMFEMLFNGFAIQGDQE